MPDADQAVISAAEKLRRATLKPDRAAIEALVVENVDYGHSSGRVHDRAVLIDDLLNGNAVFLTMDISAQTVTIRGDVAVLRHVMKAKTRNRGEPGEIAFHVLQIWQQIADEWKLIARQTVKVT